MAEVDVRIDPAEQARRIVLKAFDINGKQRKESFRIVQRALMLAAERGYRESERFLLYFRTPQVRSERLTKKWLSSLFEYISPEEFYHLSH